MLQLEVDRYTAAKHLIRDYYAWRAGKVFYCCHAQMLITLFQPLKEEYEAPLAIIGEVADDAPAKGKKPSQSKASTPAAKAPAKPAAKPGAKQTPKADEAEAPDSISLAIAKINDALLDGSQQPPAPAEDDEIGQQEWTALSNEETLFKERIQAIDTRSHAIVSSCNERVQELYGSMEQWLSQTFRRNVDAVRAVIRVVKDTIERGELLRHEIKMEDGQALIEEKSLLVPHPAPPPPLPIREPQCMF